jgi:hypothetical protein
VEKGKVERQVVPGYEVQSIPAPGIEADAHLGWHERGNPISAFQPEERISLVSDQFVRLLLWMMFGGSTRNRDRTGKVNLKLKAICQARDLGKTLSHPQIIGYRVIALLLRIRPDLLEGQTAGGLARTMGLSPRMMAHYTISFGENFPEASKVIRRASRLVNEEVYRSRHPKKND